MNCWKDEINNLTMLPQETVDIFSQLHFIDQMIHVENQQIKGGAGSLDLPSQKFNQNI